MVETHGPADALGLVGSTIDQVRFDACVDAGGFGLIYRGFHEGLGEAVAIKCLRIASIQKTNEQIREALAGRFRDETKLLYRLSQGNLDIVRCISSGTLVAPRTKEYTPYMVLEWLEGRTLSAELKDRRERKLGRRSLAEAVELLESAAGGLAYAHSHEVVHRDVKPGNLFLAQTRAGIRLKVLDFGLAKILSDEAIGVRPSVETGVGVYFCSPSYGAPEQYSAQVGKIGPWTDVYSLCLVLLEVMLGEKVRPAGSLADGLMKALDPETGSPSASDLGLLVPRGVEKLLKRCLSQNPLARPNDASVFWSSLKEAMKETPGVAPLSNEELAAMNDLRDTAVLRAASPFVATMLMDPAAMASPPPLAETAPSGSPQLAAPAVDPPPPPAAGLGATALLAPQESAHRTSPLSPPLRTGEEAMKMTMPIGSTSPLAMSMAAQSPLRPETQPPAPAPFAAPPAAAYPPQPAPKRRPYATPTHRSNPPEGARPGITTDPRAGLRMRPVTKTNTGLVALIALVILGIVGGTILWLRLRGH